MLPFNTIDCFKLFGFPIVRFSASRDEGYSRNVSCSLNLISTFLFYYRGDLIGRFDCITHVRFINQLFLKTLNE